MNIGRGLFRAWIVVTVLWMIGVGALAYSIIPTNVAEWKWQYVEQMREDVGHPSTFDWGRPYYENMRSPSVEKLAVGFAELGFQYVEPWKKLVKDGKMVNISFPDGSSLYLDTNLTQGDQEYLSQAFWTQRWLRYAGIGKLWAPVLILPPIVLFILGWALLWVGRGFKAKSA